jgi:hypothetical protein
MFTGESSYGEQNTIFRPFAMFGIRVLEVLTRVILAW